MILSSLFLLMLTNTKQYFNYLCVPLYEISLLVLFADNALQEVENIAGKYDLLNSIGVYVSFIN